MKNFGGCLKSRRSVILNLFTTSVRKLELESKFVDIQLFIEAETTPKFRDNLTKTDF